MKSISRIVQTAVGTAALALLMIPSASADTWDRKTNVTFREPVEFPGGTVLAPGSYVLKLLNSASNRNIVQVYNSDQNHMLAMVMTVPALRLEPTSKTVITFYEAPQNEPVLIHTWFYPGDLTGQEFTYPKGRVRYAQTASAGTPPLVAQSSTTTTTTTAERSTVTEETKPAEPQIAQVQPAEPPRPAPEVTQAPAEEPKLLAQAEPPKPIQDTPAAEPAAPAPLPDTLPSTASDEPLWAAGSIVLLASAFLLRARRVRG